MVLSFETMARSILVLTSLCALALLGAALFLLGRPEGDLAPVVTSNSPDVRRPVSSTPHSEAEAPIELPRPAVAEAAVAASVVPPTAVAVTKPASPSNAAAARDNTPLPVDPKWSAVLKSSVGSCQEVLAMLDTRIAAGGPLTGRERERLLAAAVDNLDWFRDYVDANDPTQVDVLTLARTQLAQRLTALGLELPDASGRLEANPKTAQN